MSDEVKYLKLRAAATRCGIAPRTLRTWAARRIVSVSHPSTPRMDRESLAAGSERACNPAPQAGYDVYCRWVG
jgi:hypothetical protein